MSDRTHTSSAGTGFLGLLAIVFITLKLTGYIGWSWWWVLSPIWGPIVLALVVFLWVAVIIAASAVGGGRR